MTVTLGVNEVTAKVIRILQRLPNLLDQARVIRAVAILYALEVKEEGQ